jgi:hypothetical protein
MELRKVEAALLVENTGRMLAMILNQQCITESERKREHDGKL